MRTREEMLENRIKLRVYIEDAFIEMLNESYHIDILGLSYRTAHVLETVDPVRYNEGLTEFESDYVSDGTHIIIDWSGEYHNACYKRSNLEACGFDQNGKDLIKGGL